MCGNLIKHNSEAQVTSSYFAAVYFQLIFKNQESWLSNTLVHTYIKMRRMRLNAQPYRPGMEGPVEQVYGSGVCQRHPFKLI